jgi:hypothetical protein
VQSSAQRQLWTLRLSRQRGRAQPSAEARPGFMASSLFVTLRRVGLLLGTACAIVRMMALAKTSCGVPSPRSMLTWR